MIDERRRGQGDARRILATRPGNPGDVSVTALLQSVLMLAAGISELSDGAVEVAR